MGLSGSKEIATKWYDEYVATNLPSSCFEGKTVAVTGCTSGTGYVLAEACVLNNAGTLLLLNRSSERSTEAHKKLQELGVSKNSKTVIETIPCDLQDIESVRTSIETIKSKYEAIDVLCNNAGIMAMDDIATKDGYDIQMQTNHISHFLLTKELFPLLKRAVELRGEARIVNHSSAARFGKPLEAEYFEKKGGNLGGNYSTFYFTGANWERYHQSKLANSAFTYELAQRLKEHSNESIKGIKSIVVTPGLAYTNLQITSTGMGDLSMKLGSFVAQSPKDGTLPLLTGCFLPTAENGDFWEPSGPVRLYGIPMKVEFDKNSIDIEQRKLLWTKSEEACGEFSVN